MDTRHDDALGDAGGIGRRADGRAVVTARMQDRNRATPFTHGFRMRAGRALLVFAVVAGLSAAAPRAGAGEPCPPRPPAPNTDGGVGDLLDTLNTVGGPTQPSDGFSAPEPIASIGASVTLGSPTGLPGGEAAAGPTIVSPDALTGTGEGAGGAAGGAAAGAGAGAGVGSTPPSTSSQGDTTPTGGTASITPSGGDVPQAPTVVLPGDLPGGSAEPGGGVGGATGPTGAGPGGLPPAVVPTTPGGAPAGPGLPAPIITLPPPAPGADTLLPIEPPSIGPSVGTGPATGTPVGVPGAPPAPLLEPTPIPLTWATRPGHVWTDAEKQKVQAVWDKMPGFLTPGVSTVERGGPKGANPASYWSHNSHVTVWNGFFANNLRDQYIYGDKINEVVMYHELSHHWAHTHQDKAKDYARMFWSKPAVGPGGLRTWTKKPGAGFVKRRRPAGVAEPANAYMGTNPHEDFAVAMEMYRYDPERLRSTADGRKRYDWIKQNVYGGKEFPAPPPPAPAAPAAPAGAPAGPAGPPVVPGPPAPPAPGGPAPGGP